MKPRIISAASGNVITLDELRAQCEVTPVDNPDSDGAPTSHPDDALLLRYMRAAVSHAETFTGLGIVQRVLEIALTSFPAKTNRIFLPWPPFIDIVSFYNGDTSDGEVDPDSYWIDMLNSGEPASLVPYTGWPAASGIGNGIRIRYTSGMSSGEVVDSDAPAMDDAIRQAILLMVGHWYAHREAVIEGSAMELPLGAKSLLRPHRVLLGMA